MNTITEISDMNWQPRAIERRRYPMHIKQDRRAQDGGNERRGMLARLTKSGVAISNELVIPDVETELFEGHSERFAVGMLAVGNQVIPGREREFQGYGRLRANVYAYQTGMIPMNKVHMDGTESDENDVRSVHFGIFENVDRRQRVVGALRLIIKSEVDSRPLPVEDFFPEAFTSGPAPIGSTEVSRYIARHGQQKVQDQLTWLNFSSGLSQIMSEGLTPTYGVVEPALERRLRFQKMPILRLAAPKLVPEYSYDNLPIKIDTDEFVHQVEDRTPGTIDALRAAAGQFTYMDLRIAPTINAEVA